MTLLIADDEELVRFTIKDMLDECGLHFDRIIEAANGSEMISLVRKYSPEIALVDIQMPGKTGLQAMEELEEEAAGTGWIILTGHAEFDYARKALKLGAGDYLLKPPAPEEMRKVLTEAMDRIRRHQKERHREFERRITAVYNSTSAPEYDTLFAEEGSWSGRLLCLDSSLTEREALEIQTRWGREIRERYIPGLPEGCRGGLTSLEDGKLILTVFHTPETSAVSGPSGPIPLPPETGLSVSILEIPPSESFREYMTRTEEISGRAALRFILSSAEPAEYRTAGREGIPEFCRKTEQAVLLAGTDQREEMETLFRDLARNIPALTPREESRLRTLLKQIFPDLPAEGSLPQILKTLSRGGEEQNTDRQTALVQQALRIVREQYSRDIGIAQIAYQLQITPNYLSSLFRKHSGVPFTRYITEIRMNRARQLLKETSLNIKEISSCVGYQSSRHFAALFRQETGLSPTEYIRKYRV